MESSELLTFSSLGSGCCLIVIQRNLFASNDSMTTKQSSLNQECKLEDDFRRLIFNITNVVMTTTCIEGKIINHLNINYGTHNYGRDKIILTSRKTFETKSLNFNDLSYFI